MSKYLKKPVDSANFASNNPLRTGATPDDPLVSDGAVIAGDTTTSSGAGAVAITGAIHEITTTGADALTLADGTEGQVLRIVMVADGGNGTLTPSNLAGGTTITFNDVGDAVTLLFTNSNWFIVGQNGVTVA